MGGSSRPVETRVLERLGPHIPFDTPKLRATIADNFRPAPPRLPRIFSRNGQGVDVNEAFAAALQGAELKAKIRGRAAPHTSVRGDEARQGGFHPFDFVLRGRNAAPMTKRGGARTLRGEFARQGRWKHNAFSRWCKRAKRRRKDGRLLGLRARSARQKEKKRDNVKAEHRNKVWRVDSGVSQLLKEKGRFVSRVFRLGWGRSLKLH